MHPMQGTIALFLTNQLPNQMAFAGKESHAVDVVADTVSNTLPSLASVLPDFSIRGIQKFGEDTLAAMFVVALMQAFVALMQYRTNPSGTLVVPPGKTVGIANPSDASPPPSSSIDSSVNATESSSAISSLAEEMTSATASSTRIPDNEKIIPKGYPKILQKINRWLFLLIPWTMEQLAFIWGRNTLVMHLGVILTVNRLFDIPNRFWAAKEEANTVDVAKADPTSLGKPPQNIVVIGDSLAVGLGSVEEFTVTSNSSDTNQKTSNPATFIKLENNQTDSGPGPVFPRVLAESLSQRFEQPIRWRSAGVDGGDLKWIDELCFEVIEDEVNQKRMPDVVVILCGPNDLKYFVSNPFQAAGPKVFRARLRYLIKKIKEVAPNAKIVVPSFPTQMFHKKSPLNIFPLNFFLDSVIGFWDSQKKMVTDSLSEEIMYFEMNPTEIFEWHKFQDHTKDPSLLAADGVHPNAKCYKLWATSLGTRIAKTLTEFSATV